MRRTYQEQRLDLLIICNNSFANKHSLCWFINKWSFGDPFYNSINNMSYNGVVGRVWFITGMIFPIYFGFRFRKRANH